MRRFVADEFGCESDEVAAVVESLVVDGLVRGGVGGSFDHEDGAARFDVEGLRDGGFGGDGFELVVGFDERDIVLLFEEGEDGLGLEVVGEDLLADFEREIGFVEGHGDAVGDAYALDADDRGSGGEGELSRDRGGGREGLVVDDSGGGAAAEGLHVFDEAAELGEVLGDLWLGDEGAFAALDFDEAASGEVLDGLADGGTADLEAGDEAVFGRELGSWAESSAEDLGSEGGFGACVEGEGVAGSLERHNYIITS